MWFIRLAMLAPAILLALGQRSGCGQAPPRSGAYTIRVNGVQRQYRLHVGTAYDRNTPTALVLGFHGWGGSGLGTELSSGFNRIANENGFITAFPTGLGDHPSGGLGWNSWNGAGTTASPGPEGRTCNVNQDYCYSSCIARPEGCDRCDWTTCFDDVAFVEALIDSISAELCIDDAKVFAWGFSNGGQFTYELGFKLAHRIAAIVPGGGHPHIGFNNPPDVSGGTRISMLNVHGTRDTTCPPFGGRSGDGWYYIAVPDALPVWANALGCTGNREQAFSTPHDGSNSLECFKRGDCGGEDLVRCTWNGGHSWPSGWGSNLAWWFFEAHSRKGPAILRAKSYYNVTAPVPYDDSADVRVIETPLADGKLRMAKSMVL